MSVRGTHAARGLLRLLPALRALLPDALPPRDALPRSAVRPPGVRLQRPALPESSLERRPDVH
ncbi:hypothetical protein [Gordonia namibiensis]|uniref:hypothetical protein n=1 Tax=Gordonia namibiensis TaxID=168480 RepID=UPI0012F68EE9|nr:hypothetical protein [Gordonia namibiensis]